MNSPGIINTVKKALYFGLFCFLTCGFSSSSLAVLTPDTFTYNRNGESSTLWMARDEDQAYLGITHLAQMAEAQLRWQSVTQQACLSNTQGLLCFNWEHKQVFKDGRLIRKQLPMRFEDNELYIPLSYAASKDFQSFSQSDLIWDAPSRQLTHQASVNLKIPEVERLEDRYRLRLDISEKTPHTLLQETNNRIWVRFVRARVEGSQILEGDNVIKDVQFVQKKYNVDMVINLGPAAQSHDLYFEEGKKSLILDVFTAAPFQGVGEKELVVVKPAVVAPAVKKKVVKKPSIPVRTSAVPSPVVVYPPVPAIKENSSTGKPKTGYMEKKSVRTIVIDAGHGGIDAGAIGARGTMEKDVNLAVARNLAKLLSKEKNTRVIMTRESDEFVPLSQRTEIANNAQADIFVSIHCNASLSSKRSGFETYFLSPDATDKAAEAVARLENSVVSLEAKKGASSSRLEELLASMAVNNQLNESSRLAALLCRTIKTRTGLDDAHVKEADFYVLRGAQMPSVLIELEYISHPVSEIRLRSSRFQGQLTRAIADAVLSFARQMRQEKEAMAAQLEKPSNKVQQ